MRNGHIRRLATAALGVAVAALLLGAAVASAGTSSAANRAGSRSSEHARVDLARKAQVTGRCFDRRLRRSHGDPRRRRRCSRPAAASGTPQPLYWGATIGSHLTGSQAPWDMTAVSKFEEDTSKKVSLVQFFQPFADCSSVCTMYSFPTTPLENVRQHGAIPVLSWSSQSIPSSLDEPDFQLSDVIEGRYDAYITEFAEAARDWGHPFFLRFNWEMNGDWFPWSEGVNGNAAGQYVAAWRHVHDIFSAAGAVNVSWVWCPFVDPNHSLNGLSSQYPGDAYVDWSALDGYNWGTNPAAPAAAQGWRSFDQLFGSTYDEIVERIAPSKPMMIGEVGSSEQGGSKAAWIEDMLAKVPADYPRIRALLWFDKFDGGMDWPIATSAGATAAFSRGIQDPMYVSSSPAELGPDAIQPPS
jgi:mannan endo-1,4-beta-mannosidase